MAGVDDFVTQIDLLAPTRAVFGRVLYGPGGRFGPRRQRDVQLVAVDRGSVRVSTGGVAVEVGPGQVVCQWPGPVESFRFDPGGPTEHRWVALRPGSGAGAAAVEALRRRDPGVVQEGPALRAIDRAARALPGGGGAGEEAARAHLALGYLAAFLGGGAAAGGPRRPARPGGDVAGPLPPPLVAMRGLISAGHAQPLRLADLAAAASVTPSHLVRLCRRELGTTPMRLLQDARVAEAAVLLRHTGLSVKEVAERVGFGDPSQLSRAFKRRRGEPPRAYRERVHAGSEPPPKGPAVGG